MHFTRRNKCLSCPRIKALYTDTLYQYDRPRRSHTPSPSPKSHVTFPLKVRRTRTASDLCLARRTASESNSALRGSGTQLRRTLAPTPREHHPAQSDPPPPRSAHWHWLNL
eukprot:2473962-Rhodomonas_salina.1